MPDWLQRALVFLAGGPDAGAGTLLLRGALVGCSLFASVQLLTMLSTRWGERHAMAKSFVLSLLLHLSFGLGWATVAEHRARQEALHRPTPRDLETLERITPVQKLVLESDQPQPNEETGDPNVWERPLDVPRTPAQRIERDAEEMALPDPGAPEALAVPIESPELPNLAGPAEEAVTPELAASSGRNQAAPAETPEAESPELTTPIAGPVLTPSAQRTDRSLPELMVPDVAPARGDAQRIAETPDSTALTAPLLPDDSSPAPLPTGAEAEVVQRKTAPASTLPADVGIGETERPAARDLEATLASRFQRNDSLPAEQTPTAEPAPLTMEAPVTNEAQELLIASRAASSRLPSADRIAPEVVRSDGPTIPVQRPDNATDTYRLRRLEKRLQTAVQNGGTETSEKAVEAALQWLATNQEPAGYWDSSKYGGGKDAKDPDGNDRRGSGTVADTGLTGMALLCFLGAGYTQDEGQYTQVIDKAIRWLIAQQRDDGFLGGDATYFDAMYCHGIASYALAEAVGMQEDPSGRPELRQAVAQAVRYIAVMQNSDGGWRYRSGARSDMSMFGWQLMAIKSAQMAGIEAPVATQRGMFEFLRDRSRNARGLKDRNGGLAGYFSDTDPPRPAMTAEAWFCKQMYGLKRTSQASGEASQYLLEHLPKRSAPNYYYWYYGTLSMFQHGGQPWNEWNSALRDSLIAEQRKTGPLAGTWDPIDPWGGLGGRIYSTTFCTLSLEVYYRFLPLHQQREPQAP